jgi:hypothetical protein
VVSEKDSIQMVEFSRIKDAMRDAVAESVKIAMESVVTVAIEKLVAIERERTDKRIAELLKDAACACPLADNEKKQVKNLFAMAEDLGHGKIDEGIREMRSNHGYMSRIRKAGDRISNVAIVSTISTCIGGLILIIIWGIVKFIETVQMGGGPKP